ncbi:MAG: flagellar biosynthetic protein FliO [Pirellulales bacterium]|nr:flagellar biosynthetic protein FliO [Pirellulales bacterium]
MPSRFFVIIVLSIPIAASTRLTAADGYRGERLEATRDLSGTAPVFGVAPSDAPRGVNTLNRVEPVCRAMAGIPAANPIQASGGGPALRPHPPKKNSPSAPSAVQRMRSFTGGRSLATMLGGLAVAIGAFFLLAWAIRHGMPKAVARLPNDVIEVLGHSTLTAKQSVHLVRLGHKLLLVSVSAAGAETLSEITDPDEVTRLISLCDHPGRNKSQKAFQQVMHELEHRRTDGLFGNNSLAGRGT